MKRWKQLLVPVVALAWLGCGEEAETERDLPAVTLSPVITVDLVERIEATGELLATTSAVEPVMIIDLDPATVARQQAAYQCYVREPRLDGPE